MGRHARRIVRGRQSYPPRAQRGCPTDWPRPVHWFAVCRRRCGLPAGPEPRQRSRRQDGLDRRPCRPRALRCCPDPSRANEIVFGQPVPTCVVPRNRLITKESGVLSRFGLACDRAVGRILERQGAADCGAGLGTIRLSSATSLSSALVDCSSAPSAARVGRIRAGDATSERIRQRRSSSRSLSGSPVPRSCGEVRGTSGADRFGRRDSQRSRARLAQHKLL